MFDLKTKEFLAGIKALGLINKFITCPLWSMLEDKHISAIDMDTKYLEVVTYLEDSAKNIADFMNGRIFLFGNRTKKDKEFDYLLIDSDYDPIVQSYLEVLLPALCQLSQTIFKDHLPGGKLCNLQEETVSSLKGVPKTSCFAESVFGQMDQLLRKKPNITTLAAESCILFSNNKTLDWLESTPEN